MDVITPPIVQMGVITPPIAQMGVITPPVLNPDFDLDLDLEVLEAVLFGKDRPVLVDDTKQ